MHDFVPIIAPLATGEDGTTLNINADVFAARLAAAVGAEKLVLLTDVQGVQGPTGELLSSISADEAEALIASGVISGGMIPKVEYALAAIADGVRKVHIIDGRLEHALLLEIFTQAGVGTQVVGGATPRSQERAI
jgi:acetylglutamate kinase